MFPEPILLGLIDGRFDQLAHIPSPALMRQLRSPLIACAVPTTQLPEQYFVVGRERQILDAITIQRQSGAQVLRIAFEAKRVLDDAEFAANGHFFGADATAHGNWRAAGGEDEVGRLKLGPVVGVEEVVVVVGNDGVFGAADLDQDGALGALDVETVSHDVLAGLAHAQGVEPRALQLAGIFVAEDGEGAQPPAVVHHVADEEAARVTRGGDDLR